MGSERHINYQWVENGLFELSERYGESALNLINNADDDEKISLTLMIRDIIRGHIAEIDYLLRKGVDTNIKGSLDFIRSGRDNLGPEILQEITPLITEFREKVINISRSFSVEERMGKTPLMMGAVLGCIRDLRKRIDEFYLG